MKKCSFATRKNMMVLLCCCIMNVGCGLQEYHGDGVAEVIRIENAEDGQTKGRSEHFEEPELAGGSSEPFGVSEPTESPDLEEEPEVSEGLEGDSEPLEQYSADWSEERLLDEIAKRSPYREQCAYYGEWMNYMENVREVGDIAMYTDPLYDTDIKVYAKEDFEGVPPLILHLAKNEIYARHGYIFKDMNLNHYFLIQVWYLPRVTPAEFDDSVFSETERHNLEILRELDKYEKETFGNSSAHILR